MSTTLLYTKTNRQHSTSMIARYLSFISSRANIYIKGATHYHHILPKARDFFPEYKDLSLFPWNGVHLTAREHFIAHWMLARAFPNSSQARVFYYLTNNSNKRRGRDYEAARKAHIDMMATLTQDPARNAKISATLTGRSKSETHKNNMKGRPVSNDTRAKLRAANLGKKMSEESRTKMSVSRTGKSKAPNNPEAIERMRQTKLAQRKRWCNNGVEEKLLSVLPDGWTYGKLKSNTKGRKHYNNGLVSKLFIVPPDDTWVLGRLTH